MLAWLALVLGLVGASPIAPESGELDDPKCARGECLPPRPRPLDEDDPKLARGLRLSPPTARFEVGYRFFEVRSPYGGTLPFHLVELDGYPVSGIFRLGLSLNAGGAERYSAWLADVGLSVGVQYPYRVTPFFDARFSVGFIGADIVNKKVVSYEYRPTLEAGLSVFLKGHMHLVASVGWSYTVYGGVNAKLIQQEVNDGETPVYTVHTYGLNTAAVRVGLGF
jgi:hypothetical protein